MISAGILTDDRARLTARHQLHDLVKLLLGSGQIISHQAPAYLSCAPSCYVSTDCNTTLLVQKQPGRSRKLSNNFLRAVVSRCADSFGNQLDRLGVTFVKRAATMEYFYQPVIVRSNLLRGISNNCDELEWTARHVTQSRDKSRHRDMPGYPRRMPCLVSQLIAIGPEPLGMCHTALPIGQDSIQRGTRSLGNMNEDHERLHRYPRMKAARFQPTSVSPP